MIPHNRVVTTPEDIEAVSRVVASGQLAQGPEVEALEAEMCEGTGRKYAVAVASGLAALRLTSLYWSAGTPAIPAYSCVALMNAVRTWTEPFPGVKIVDAVPGSWTMAADMPAGFLAVAVNTFGVLADVPALHEAGAVVIEDCTHGFGGHESEAEVISFYATKLIGGAEGGMVLTDNADLANFVRDHRDYGDKPMGTRLNDKMSDVHAALARSKLARLPSLIEERADLAALYLDELRGLEGKIVLPVTGDRTWYRFVIETPDAVRWCGRLREMNVGADQPVWDWLPPETVAPVARRAYRTLVSLPLYPGLEKGAIRYVAKCVRELANEV